MGSTASSDPPAVARVAARTDVEDFIAALMDLPAFRRGCRRRRWIAHGGLVRQNAGAVWFGPDAVSVTRLTEPHDH